MIDLHKPMSLPPSREYLDYQERQVCAIFDGIDKVFVDQTLKRIKKLPARDLLVLIKYLTALMWTQEAKR